MTISDRFQVFRRLEGNGFPARNDNGGAGLRIHPLSVLTLDYAEATKSTDQHLLAPAEPAFDYVENQVHHSLGVGIRHAPMHVVNRFTQVVFVHVQSSESRCADFWKTDGLILEV